MPLSNQNRKRIAVLHDTVMAPLALIVALMLRLGEAFHPLTASYLPLAVWLFTVCALTAFIRMRLYRSMWRFASAEDLLAITKAASLTLAIFVPLLFLLTRLEGFPRSAIAIAWLLLILFLSVPRLLYRWWRDGGITRWAGEFHDRRVPVLLVGATTEAEMFIRETARRGRSHYKVVAILDDAPDRIGRSLHGVPVYGPFTLFDTVMAKLARKGLTPHKLVLADLSLTGEALRTMVAHSEAHGLSIGRLPRLEALQEQSERIPLQPIPVEDLLGRPQRIYQPEKLAAFTAGKRVLVTGAGGSIGSELCRQIAGFAPAELVLFELSEYHLYRIDQEMAERFPHLPRRAVLGDVRDAACVRTACDAAHPHIMFHAAAIKHVPLAEENPLAAISTNVLGTHHVAQAAIASGAEAMVLISTDKAVHPTNVMGATKRAAERVVQQAGLSGSATRFLTVRFGNVLGSTGSVVPLFTRQIAEGGPVTITDPQMTRYFMTIREAVTLVLHAAMLGSAEKESSGALFVLDMGAPVRIEDLARQMIRLAGLQPETDIALSYVGMRPGEKLEEELFYTEEAPSPTLQPGILLASQPQVAAKNWEKEIEGLRKLCQQSRPHEALQWLKKHTPEYRT
jgi:FlaA1/EpsC-like NDP-sugar epimerase